MFEMEPGTIVGLGYDVTFGVGCDGTPDSALITGDGMGYVEFPENVRMDTQYSLTIMVQIMATGNGDGPILR